MPVTLTAGELETALGVDLTAATRLLSVAADMVNTYTADAPEGVANESACRIAGYLQQQPKSGIRREGAGPLSLSYFATGSALRLSGAMALLSPYKVRRAGVISLHGAA